MNAPLAEQYPDAWAAIEKAGFVSLVEMAKRFTAPRIMDHALGYSSATAKWCQGKMPGGDAERKARLWLDNQAKPAIATAAGGDMLLVVCPEGVSAKARRLLAVLGCEVEPL